jgi:hypothetical protein
MRLQTRHDYKADPVEVFSMLTDEAFLRAKLEARGDKDVQVLECGRGPDGVRIVTRRMVALDVPGFAKRFLRPANAVTQTDLWSDPDDEGARTGTWRVEASGVPVAMSGTMTLTGAPGHTAEQIEGTVTSSVPFVGGRLAGLVGSTATDNLAAEQAFARRWLAARRRKARRDRTAEGQKNTDCADR